MRSSAARGPIPAVEKIGSAERTAPGSRRRYSGNAANVFHGPETVGVASTSNSCCLQKENVYAGARIVPASPTTARSDP